jgi:hypothetical protein
MRDIVYLQRVMLFGFAREGEEDDETDSDGDEDSPEARKRRKDRRKRRKAKAKVKACAACRRQRKGARTFNITGLNSPPPFRCFIGIVLFVFFLLLFSQAREEKEKALASVGSALPPKPPPPVAAALPARTEPASPLSLTAGSEGSSPKTPLKAGAAGFAGKGDNLLLTQGPPQGGPAAGTSMSLTAKANDIKEREKPREGESRVRGADRLRRFIERSVGTQGSVLWLLNFVEALQVFRALPQDAPE